MTLRDVAWRCGVPARWVLILSIRLYRGVLSGWLGGQCRFFPTCSHYAEQAIRELGAVRGAGLATWRLVRCNPYGRGGIDPVPASSSPHALQRLGSEYDDVIRLRRGVRV